MTQHVFENSMVAHVWAQRGQAHGRSSNGNFYFDGYKLHSYGSHFVVAQFVDLPNKAGLAILFNTDTYSPSTGRHQYYARNAIRGLPYPVFNLSKPTQDHKANLAGLQAKAEAHLEAAEAKRQKGGRVSTWEANRERNLAAAASYIAQCTDYAAAFGLKWKPAPAAWKRAKVAAAKAYAVERAERQRRYEEQAEQARVQDAERFAEWQNGAPIHCPHSYTLDANGSVYMRAVGDELQTSRGAVVPLSHALRVFQFIRQVKASGVAFRPNGRVVRVGPFHVDEITPAGDMIAGCHRFTWQRIAEVAERVGAFALPPSDEAATPKHAAA